MESKYKIYVKWQDVLLAFAAGTITCICGGNYYLHLRRESLLALAAGVVTCISGGNYKLGSGSYKNISK